MYIIELYYMLKAIMKTIAAQDCMIIQYFMLSVLHIFKAQLVAKMVNINN